jgi:hypothetical protein
MPMHLKNRWMEAQRYRYDPKSYYSIEILEKLNALPERPHPDAIDKVIEDYHTTYSKCNCCDDWHEAVAVLTGGASHRSYPYQICGRCLLKALEMLEEG